MKKERIVLRFQTVGQQVRVGEQHDWLDAGLLVVHARSGMTERGFCWPGSDCRRAVSEKDS